MSFVSLILCIFNKHTLKYANQEHHEVMNFELLYVKYPCIVISYYRLYLSMYEWHQFICVMHRSMNCNALTMYVSPCLIFFRSCHMNALNLIYYLCTCVHIFLVSNLAKYHFSSLLLVYQMYSLQELMRIYFYLTWILNSCWTLLMNLFSASLGW